MKIFWLRTCNHETFFFCKTLYLKCLHSDHMLCNASDTFKILAYSAFCFFRCIHIQSYSELLGHIHAYWDIVKAYSGIFSYIQHTVQNSHIRNLAIFWALAYLELGAYLKSLRNVDQGFSEPCHSALSTHIQNLKQHLHTQKPGILRFIEYTEPFHNCIPTHIQNTVTNN